MYSSDRNQATKCRASAPPATPTNGDYHVSNDGPIAQVRSAGTWVSVIPGAGPIVVPDASWTTVSGTPNLAIDGGLLNFIPTPHATRSLIYKAAPATPYTITVGYVVAPYNITNTTPAILQVGFYNIAADDGLVLVQCDDSSRARAIKYTTASTAGGASVSKTGGVFFTGMQRLAGISWMRLTNDGTDITLVQMNGPRGPAQPFYTELESGFSPDAIMLAMTGASAQIVHYEVT